MITNCVNELSSDSCHNQGTFIPNSSPPKPPSSIGGSDFSLVVLPSEEKIWGEISPLWRNRDFTATTSDGPTKPKIFSPEDLHQLIDPKYFYQRSASDPLGAIAHLVFYSTWYPQETQTAFETIWEQSRSSLNNLLPLETMQLEREYSPNPEHAVIWLEETLSKWNADRTKSSFRRGLRNYDLSYFYWDYLNFTKSYWDLFDAGQKERVKTHVSETARLIKKGWASLSDEKFYINASPFLKEASVSAEDFLLPYSTGKKKPRGGEFLLFLLENDIVKAPLTPANQEFIWNFLVENQEGLFGMRHYWFMVTDFLCYNPDYVPNFLQRGDQWYAFIPGRDRLRSEHSIQKKVPFDINARDVTSIHQVYVTLLNKGLIPVERENDVFDRISRYTSFKNTALAKGNFTSLEKMAAEELWDKNLARPKWAFPRIIQDYSVDQLLDFAVRAMPDWNREELVFSERLLKIAKNHDEAEARVLLQNFYDGDMNSIPDAVHKDPLWVNIMSAYGYAPLDSDMNNWTPEKKYTSFSWPNWVSSIGGQDPLAWNFFKIRHPYGLVYNLPEDLRPTGKNLSFVSVDFYYDLEKFEHPDKEDLEIVSGAGSIWDNSEYHGVLTSDQAVGDRYGLAPNAKLYVISHPVDHPDFIPMVISALEKTLELKQKDNSVAAVGVSLGFEVPEDFENYLQKSPRYIELKNLMDELTQRGIAIFVSSGNTNKPGIKNILDFFPDIQLIGAADTQLTASYDDDHVSSYCTYRDENESVDYFAPADPVFAYASSLEHPEWLPHGGTSSAQPMSAGSYLLVREVQPSFTMEQALQLLKLTSRTLSTNATLELSANPMTVEGYIDLPIAITVAGLLQGSIYTPEQQEKLSSLLTGMNSESFRKTEIFRNVSAILQPKGP